MIQPNTPGRVSVGDHYGKRHELDLGQCPYYGIVRKPSYLAETPKRLGSDWIVQRLLNGQQLALHRIGHEGTWFVVDMEDMQGEVINTDQLRDLQPEAISLAAAEDSSSFQIKVETTNYRALRQAQWNPTGVCALVGPNGSGKTTLLTLLDFFRNAFLRNAPVAMDQMGGAYGLRSWNSNAEVPVSVALSVGGQRWQLELTTQGSTLTSKLGESVTDAGEIVLSRPPWGQQFSYRGKDIPIEANDDRMAIRIVAESSVGDEFHRFADMVKKIRVYRSYNIWSLQTNGSRQGGDLYQIGRAHV